MNSGAANQAVAAGESPGDDGGHLDAAYRYAIRCGLRWPAMEGARLTTNETVRTHVVIPRDVVAAVDRLAGRRKRSEFIAEAVREKLTRELQRTVLAATAGALAGAE